MRPATGFRLSCAVLVLTGLIGLLVASADAQPAPKKGGALKIALIGEPPTLDMHTTTAVITREISLQAMGRELDPKKRYALWERIQTIFYEDAARIRLGDYFRVDARRKELQGFRPGPYMHFWNVWLDR